MLHVWLDVFTSDRGLFVTNDTMYIESMESVADLGILVQVKRGYRQVVGKSVTYHIRSNGWNEEKTRNFAVWYHNNKEQFETLEFTD